MIQKAQFIKIILRRFSFFGPPLLIKTNRQSLISIH
jgi:hypothetical protein